MASWQGKTVLVTGGSGGLGLAIAEAFAQRGANVAIAARQPARLQAAADALRRGDRTVLAVTADVTRQADVERMVGEVIERFGRLDVLVNNAGRSARGSALDTTPEALNELLELNLLATVRCTRAAADYLLAARGHLVNIGSLASKSASRFLGGYPASKHALAGYTQQLRLELAPQGVHVMLACPGPIARPDAGRRYDEDAAGLPEAARQPGAGVRLPALRPERVAEKIVRGCERRIGELVMPARARLLLAVAALWPALGDWIVRRRSG